MGAVKDVVAELKENTQKLYGNQDAGSAYDVGGLSKVSSGLIEAKRQGVEADKVKQALFESFPKERLSEKVTSVKDVNEKGISSDIRFSGQRKITETAESYIADKSSVVNGFMDGSKTLANVMDAVHTLNSSIDTGRRADNYWQQQLREKSRNPQDVNRSRSSGSGDSWGAFVANQGSTVQVR